jgi:hypothetical protein
MDLNFKTFEYLNTGSYTLLSVDENSKPLCEFTDLAIYQMGDVNMDGGINSRDVLMIKQFVVKMIELTDVQKVYANVYVDTDKDGNPQVSSRDAVLIQQYVVKMPVKLGDRFTLTFVMLDGARVTYSIRAGETIPAMPTAPEGYAWSMSETELVAPDGAPVSEDTTYYLVSIDVQSDNTVDITVSYENADQQDAHDIQDIQNVQDVQNVQNVQDVQDVQDIENVETTYAIVSEQIFEEVSKTFEDYGWVESTIEEIVPDFSAVKEDKKYYLIKKKENILV